LSDGDHENKLQEYLANVLTPEARKGRIEENLRKYRFHGLAWDLNFTMFGETRFDWGMHMRASNSTNAKNVKKVAVLLMLVAGMLLIGAPGGAQGAVSLGSCIADGNGHFPAATLGCALTIPNDTAPGEYNIVATCPTPSSSVSPYPPGATSTGTLTVSSNRVNPGQTITLSGDGCAPNALVTFTLDRIGPVVALGGLRLSLSGVAEAQTGTRTLTARITVIGPALGGKGTSTTPGAAKTTSAGTGTLARTGIDVGRYLLVAGTAIGIGAVFSKAGRRRMRRKDAGPA